MLYYVFIYILIMFNAMLY